METHNQINNTTVYSNFFNNNNNTINNNTIYSTRNNVQLPCITDNKRIYIHKPSDFTKNKYTFLGNLSNNSDILNFDNRKFFNSPKFSMKDIKKQLQIENKIIGSILKDEISNLPSLLRSYIPIGNNNIKKQKILEKEKISLNNNSNVEVNKNDLIEKEIDLNNSNNDNSNYNNNINLNNISKINNESIINNSNLVINSKNNNEIIIKEKTNNNFFSNNVLRKKSNNKSIKKDNNRVNSNEKSQKLVNIHFLIKNTVKKNKNPEFDKNKSLNNRKNYNIIVTSNNIKNLSFSPKLNIKKFNNKSLDYLIYNGKLKL